MADSKLELFEGKVAKAPFVWHGEKNRWKAWSLKMRGYIGSQNSKLLRMMRIVMKHSKPVTNHADWEPDQVKLDYQFYGILTALTDGEALDENFGLERWR